MNELEDRGSDEEDSANENVELSDKENYNVHCPMNVFALKLILTLGATNVTRSQMCAVDT